jgi:glycerate 2-kinase
MSVVVALDSFKGSIAAADACAALAAGWRDAAPAAAIVLRPMADGGEGTLDAFAAAVGGAERMPVRVTGPDGVVVDAAWLLLPPTPDAPRGTGVVELASTSGIELLRRGLRAADASTRGFGEAIAAALENGVDRLVLGIGSSASTDGGAGLLAALGARFADAAGGAVPDGLRGVARIATADLAALRSPPPGGALVLCDVRAPLLGPRGAAAVFGPQKGLQGAGAADAALARFAALLPADPAAPGAGAAGGAGFGLLAWGAVLAPGAPEVARLVRLDDAVSAASVVVTGEGRYDAQSAAGKVPGFVAALAGRHGVRAALVAGGIRGRVTGFADALSLGDLAGSTEAAMADPARWLREAGRELAERTSLA